MVKGITNILKNDTEVQTYVGLNAAGTKYKVYPVVCTQPEVAPYSVVVLTGKSPFAECKGAGPNTYTCTYDVYSFHKNYDQAEALDKEVVVALDKPDGGIFNNVVFQEIRHTNTIDGAYNEEFGLFSKVSSFEAVINEDQAT